MIDEQLQKLIEEVKSGQKYRQIHTELVAQIARNELQKKRSWKETVKAVRNKLHQVGGAYQPVPIRYDCLIEDLQHLPADIQDPEARSFCLQVMQQHTSTRERLPILDHFYKVSLANLSPVESLLDIACGLNPLALAWMPLSSDAKITVCDIYQDQIDFLNAFFGHFNIHGTAFCCDLTQHIPIEKAQVALVLKTIPCLEQIDKGIGERLLDGLQVDNLLVSFPARSLGGREKGMRQFYSDHFLTIISEFDWQVEHFTFDNEEAFFIHK